MRYSPEHCRRLALGGELAAALSAVRTQREVARLLGVTKGCVAWHERLALAKIAAAMNPHHDQTESGDNQASVIQHKASTTRATHSGGSGNGHMRNT